MFFFLNFIFFIYYYYVVLFFKIYFIKLNFFILLKYFNLSYFKILSGLNSDMFLNNLFYYYISFIVDLNNKNERMDLILLFVNILVDFKYLFFIFLTISFKYRFFIIKILNFFKELIFFGMISNSLSKYFFFKSANYNFIYQNWYKFAKGQKNTYLSMRFRLVYLTNKFVKQEFFNDNLFKDDVQEFFVLRRKTFFDSHFKPVKIRKFVPLVNLKRKFYTKRRRNYSLKGLLFFYLKDYEDRINKKEQQQKTLRIYEGIFGTYIYQELIKKSDQKQAKFVKMKLNRE